MYSEADNNDNNNNNNSSSSSNTINADDSNNKNENTQSINLSQHQMQASGLNIDEYSSSSSSITNSFVCDKKTSILLASGALSLPDSEQEKRILLANVGNWEAVMLSSLNEKVYHFLTSLENIQDVLVDQPIGQWMLPITTKSVTGECIATNRNHLLHHFITTSSLYKCISSHEYTELSKTIGESINRDWLIFPQYRYAVSQLFAGVANT